MTICRRRVETAAGLLLHTDQSVTQIGRSVGAGPNYFARRFKATSAEPTSYRSARRQDQAAAVWLDRRT